jgi:hypothetical protein
VLRKEGTNEDERNQPPDFRRSILYARFKNPKLQRFYLEVIVRLTILLPVKEKLTLTNPNAIIAFFINLTSSPLFFF